MKKMTINKLNFVLTMAILLAASQGHAHFVDPTPDGQTKTTISFSGWSWSAAKSKVLTSFSAFKNYLTNNIPHKDSIPRDVAAVDSSRLTSPKQTSPEQTSPAAVGAGTVVAGPAPLPNTNFIQATSKLKALKIPKVATPAIPFSDKNLIMGHNGIPVFEFKKFKTRVAIAKIKRVPLLNIGVEAELGALGIEDMVVEPFKVIKFEATAALAGPELMSKSEFKMALGELPVPAKGIEQLEIPFLEPEQKVTPEKIAKLVYTLGTDSPVTELVVTKFTAEDLKLLRGLILFEKKDQCHVASGIFSDLVETATSEDVKLRSHFLLGVCLHEMNLPSEAFYHLKKVIKAGDERYLATAIKTMVEELPFQYEMDAAETLIGAKSELGVPEDSVAEGNLLKAKFYIKKGQSQKALEFAVKVPVKHPKYYKAQYLASVAEYELGKLDAAMDRQKTLAVDLQRRGTNKDILALIQVNLGRIAFQKGKYKESLDAFQKVPKEHPLWLQALTEQAWTQLQSKDAAGAIGNMHSIQSPYFDGVFKPESYIVRSIGYINICQYPDAYKSLAYLEHHYLPWLSKIDEYLKKEKDPYQAVISHLQSKTMAESDGLPFQVLREAARQRDFLNHQEGINQLIDENSGYAFVSGLIEKDKRSLIARRNATIAKVGQLKLKISKARTTPGAMKDFNAWKFELVNYEEFLSVFEFKVATLKEGLEGFQRLTPKAQGRIAEEKNFLKKAAGKVLLAHIVRMQKDLKENLENNELLKYEIYAGSGENLRYKVAGGKVGASSVDAPGDRKPSGEKWDFAGEFWEDEIGNYRSSLKNNCQTRSRL